MASVYTNNIRLEEMATGDQSGSWGDTTNSNLEAIASAFGYGVKSLAADADETLTMANVPTADTLRSMYLKINSDVSLSATRTVTLAPASVSKVWIIENTTTGGQSIDITQGSGSAVTIAHGQARVIYTTGAGSGTTVFDAFKDLSITDLFVDDDLKVGDDISLTSDASVIKFGADTEIKLTHVADTGLLLTETGGGNPTLQFRDSNLSVGSSADGQLDIAADTEVQIVAPTVDINAGTAMTVDTTTLTVTGNTAADGDVTLTGASYNAVWDKSDNALEFADNAKVTFGAGSDLSISHDTTGTVGSYITETGTGSLNIQGQNIIFANADGSEEYGKFFSGAGVEFNYADATKFATTATGVDITGTATMDGLTVDGDAAINQSSGTASLELHGDDADLSGALYIGNQVNQGGMVAFGTDSDPDAGFVRYDTGSNTMCFKVNSTREIFSLDNEGRSGIARVQLGACTVQGGTGADFADVLVNSSDQPTSSNATSGFIYNSSGGMSELHISAGSTSSSRTHAEFINTNGTVGSITTSGSATAFNTSSDYRLKQDVSYEWDATEKLLQLQPVTYAFKADPSTTVEGFLAHELQEHSPNAVTGEKDGDTMQSVDHSKLVPLLVKTIQELEARITDLEIELS